MTTFSLRSLLLAAFVLSNCISWTASRHHFTHNVLGHRTRHRRQGAGLYLSASYVIPGGEGTGWGEWGEVSPCSRTCGGGVASQKRICLQIGPNGQPQCTGGDTKYFSCETQDCPAGSKDFREQQCSEFDDVAFRGIKHQWVPYTQAPNPCELNCMPHGERFYYRHRTKVVDGTRCNDESFDVCVNGTCQPVGCDMMLGSGAREDKCRECRGTGAYCQTIQGLLDATELKKGYVDMLHIPEGATSIVIEEVAPSTNYLALRSRTNNTFYLNGDYHIDFPRSLVIAGALWYYERSQQGFAAPDKLRCLGPTNEPLILTLLLQGENVGIKYEYSVPNDRAPPRNKRYNWVQDKFTPCSLPCGEGYQTTNVTCRSREELEIVDDELCDFEVKPPTNQSCNLEKCAAQWTPQPWGECSKRCGEGGIRSREVICTQIISNGFPSTVADKTCFDILGPKPPLFEVCNENATCPEWFVGRWKPCDKLCDEGKQSRQVVCYQKNEEGRIEVLKDSDCEDEKPSTEQKCLLQPCDGVDWVVTDWIGCDSCLSINRSRTATCATKDGVVVNDSFCSYHATPETQEACDRTMLPPCEVQWYATQWSKCSVDCGKGIQSRKVFCGLFDGASVLKVDDSRCAGQPKYNETKECEIPKEECPSKWFSSPWTECSKTCGGGEQYRRVMCLRGGDTVTDCVGDAKPEEMQTCNTGPCDDDELLPRSTGEPFDPQFEDENCIMEEETYAEVGLDDDGKSTPEDIYATMFSDSPTEGSGMWTTYTAEHESTFETDELLTTGTDSTGTSELDIGSGDDTTDTTLTDDTGATSNDTETTGTDVSGSTESSTTEKSGSTEADITATTSTGTDYEESDETSETASTKASTEASVSGDTSTEPEVTGSESTDTDTTDSDATDSSTTDSGSTETTVKGETSETSVTTGSGDTEETTAEPTGTSETGSSVTSESLSTETSESSSTDETDITTENTESTESTVSGGTETSESDSTTESESTITEETTTEISESTGTTESTESGGTETTESTPASSTETTENTKDVTTDTTESTDAGSTQTTESPEDSSTQTTETTEDGSTQTSKSTEDGSTQNTESEETTTENTGTTELSQTTTEGPTGTESTESTEAPGSTESTENTSTEGSTTEITDATGTTESTGSTESSPTGDTTEITGTTESTETSETTEATSGSTESTVTEETGSTQSTEQGSTETSEGTEISSESSTTEAPTGTTSWDLSTVLTTKKLPVCRPRSCTRSKFGCCPDKKTVALGPFDEGCRKPQTCAESVYGCCPDGLSPAQGPAFKGCPDEHCEETLFGCCESDGKTPSQGNDQEGCPPPPPACIKSKYGCCNDETEAQGPGKEGCPETSTTVTISSEDNEETESTSSPFESSTTPVPESCTESEFGCCFDNVSAATGPDMQGCPCDATAFGCCPDSVQPAKGPEFEGCVKSCNTSIFGCCPDGKTPAHGPSQEGCCLQHPFGCCPDNRKPADGPHHEGCGCQYGPYGCCPDNATIATGAGYRGCGCQYAEHGCCPDRHTEASGPDFEGCKCHTYQFGCCPDGVTIAVGPNGQGCYCQHSNFGCCGDEQTHAKGLNKQGCDCSTSKYGCCLDGVSEASGPKFEGCAEKPENKQASCALRFERGPCRNYSVGWYYDAEYGGCSRFWYGGCEGNGNRFSTKEECEDTCVSPPAKDACHLPQIKGACTGYNVRWYFDNQRETCSSFIYGGCLGNANNFETLDRCQAQCEPERAADQCSLAIERGRCSGNFVRWGYNKETRQCDQFIWGGCEGNTNRFSTEAACLLRCNPPGKPQPECLEKQNAGNCTETEARWSFVQTEGRCTPFYYTGCGGNGNKYYTKEECDEACPPPFEPELCALPASTGDCSEYREKWYYDTKDKRCRQFYYGGCGGNGNRFETEQECERRCTEVATTVPPVTPAATPPQQPTSTYGFCFLSIDAGPCNQLESKWGYDYTKGKCVSFQFGGCGGNRNNFQTEEQCNSVCKHVQDVCQLPMLPGPCDESLMRWFYNAETDSCSQFAYGGCEGNDNNFGSREECESRCRSAPAPAPTQATTTTVKVDSDVPSECVSSGWEPCTRDNVGEVWYYDQETRSCTAHQNVETGDECRSVGTFYSQEACERSCGAFRNIDVCRLPLEPGPCTDYVPKYHYNASSQRCEEFAYGGCLGGANRFSTAQECALVCQATADPCTLPAEPGNCLGNLEVWAYDLERDQCYKFIYGGCGGNDNKFDSREACEGRCKKNAVTTTIRPQPEDECRAPASLYPCSNEYVYYYDERSGRCEQAAIGGCSGSSTVYRSEEECERRCGAFRGVDVCRASLDPGECRGIFPKFYFDKASGSCREFNYGGCNGGPNRFSTSEECEQVCSNAGPARQCLQPVSTGERCEQVPERRWHYDITRADCLVFSYQGCGGTENNFRSYEECTYLCKVNLPESEICERYAEECSALEASCEHGVRRGVAAEGCERCECEPAASCEAEQRECVALRCQYLAQRYTAANGCEACRCHEDPCSRNPCPPEQKCVPTLYKDPDTHQEVYFPACETNEIQDCSAYLEECSRLQCAYGVQRTRAAGGCERCACVPEEVDCAPLRQECAALRCSYGVNRTSSNDGCERCKCFDVPCSTKQCPEGERCVATPYRDPVTQEGRYLEDCRISNKPGVCPSSDPNALNEVSECRSECRDDADCRGEAKCCAQGCSRVCVRPDPHTTPLPVTTHRPDIPQAPEVNTETEPQIAATEGGKATLRCLFHGNPPPKITWRFGEVTVDGDEGRYRLLSDGALEIVSLFRNDSGVYICVGTNELGSAEQQVTLTVADPVRLAAGIAGAVGATVTGELDQPLAVRCSAYGFPTPGIYWYRGVDGTLVPYSSPVYEARGNELTIKRLALDTLGEYVCQAYNGEGKAATWRVSVQAYRPPGDDSPNSFLVDRRPEVLVTPRAPTLPPAPYPVLTTTRHPLYDVPLEYTVPIQTRLAPASTTISAGSQLSLPCEVDGYPEPEVYWTKDDVRLQQNDRMWISGSRLTVDQTTLSDGGVYACHASNAYSSHSSSVRITVQEVSIPANCVDNPTFANCALIVQSRFCIHKYYSKFCCKSCVEAGQLDPRDALMQSDQPFWRKK